MVGNCINKLLNIMQFNCNTDPFFYTVYGER